MFVGNKVTKVIDEKKLKNNKIAVVKFFDTTEEGGVVKAIKGIDFLNSTKEILYWQLDFKPGDRIHRPTDGGNRIGFCFSCTEGREAMAALQDEIDKRVIIEYE